MDEQNAQTQEHEGFILGLSESEEKKDLKSDDRACHGEGHGEGHGAAKGRSLRRGTVALVTRGAAIRPFCLRCSEACLGKLTGAFLRFLWPLGSVKSLKQATCLTYHLLSPGAGLAGPWAGGDLATGAALPSEPPCAPGVLTQGLGPPGCSWPYATFAPGGKGPPSCTGHHLGTPNPPGTAPTLCGPLARGLYEPPGDPAPEFPPPRSCAGLPSARAQTPRPDCGCRPPLPLPGLVRSPHITAAPAPQGPVSLWRVPEPARLCVPFLVSPPCSLPRSSSCTLGRGWWRLCPLLASLGPPPPAPFSDERCQ